MENKGVVIEGPGKIGLKDIPLRELNSEEVLVRIKFVAICGSDKKLFAGTYTAPHIYPVVIGHEWVGELVEVGSEASKKWAVGDIVTGDCSIFCGKCSNCLRNDKNHCEHIQKKGITQDGGCAQYIIVNQMYIYHCPRVPDLRAVALVEPLAVSVEAVINRISTQDMKAVRNALIIGAGGIGSLAVFALIEHGIPQITITDLSRDKLDIVDSFGFSNVRTVRTDLSDDAIKVTGADAGFDLIIQGAGSASALKRSIELSNPIGKIVCIGHQKNIDIDFGLVMKKSLSIITSIGSSGGFEEAIKILEKHFANAVKLITHIVPMDKAEEYFETRLDNPEDVKVLIDLN
jgi:2-desacetyl-2-hydroxyethyl bacteriochlorophyllide A dehydrogenase